MAGNATSLGHCNGCGRRWNGLAEAHCPTCHLQFGSDTGFDRHRTGDYATGRRCMTVDELLKPRIWKGVEGKPTLVPIERHGGTYWVTEVRVVAPVGAGGGK